MFSALAACPVVGTFSRQPGEPSSRASADGEERF